MRKLKRSLRSPLTRALTLAGAGGGFDPSSLGTRLQWWYEAADASTLGQTSAGPSAVAALDPIGYIADKSGKGRTLTQATAGNRIKLNVDGSGRPYFYFDGTKTIRLDAASFNLSAETEVTVFMAAFVDATDAVTKIPYYFKPAGGGGHFTASANAANGTVSTGVATPNSLSYAANTTRVYAYHHAPGATNATRKAYLVMDGRKWGNSRIADVAPHAFGTGPLQFGGWSSGSLAWEGGIYAMLAVSGPITDAEAANITGYLAGLSPAVSPAPYNPLYFSHSNDWFAETANIGPAAQAFSALYYDTAATSVDITYYAQGAVSGYVNLALYIDGVFQNEIVPSAYGAFTTTTVALPAGSKRVCIVNSAMSGNLGSVYSVGTVVSNVVFNAPATPYEYPTTGRVLIYGDSVSTGGHATPLTQNAYVMRLRGMTTTDISLYGTSGRGFKIDYDWPGTVGGRLGFVDIIRGYNPAVLWMAMGVNDYGQAAWSAASFGTAYAATLDALHAALPSLQIYAQSPLNPAYGATPNAQGSTLQDYCDAVQAACVGRAWCTFVAGSSIITSPGTELTDGVHPNNAGNLTYANYIKSALSLP